MLKSSGEKIMFLRIVKKRLFGWLNLSVKSVEAIMLSYMIDHSR